jgi:drug/metabolite transporter (DMT)-like permease
MLEGYKGKALAQTTIFGTNLSMMARKQTLVRFIIFIASIPFVGLIITEKEPNWLYYLSLAFILAGTAFIQYQNWKNGKQEQVKKRLITYVAIICGCIALSLIMNR